MAISNVTSNSRPGICTSSTRPSAPYEGQLIYETDTNRVLVWDNSAWVMIADTDQPPGLQLISSATITSGSALNLDDVFSDSFTNYRIVIDNARIVSSVTGVSIGLRVSGATNTAGYYNVRQGFDYSTGVAGAAPTANGSAWNIALIIDSGNAAGCVVDIFNPFLAQKTGYVSQGTDSRTNGYGALSSSGFHNNASSFTGVSIYHGNTYTNIRASVYGYRG